MFWVLSTGAGQANVSVALPYRLEAGTVYSQIDDSRPTQRLVMAESLALVAKVSALLFGAAGAPLPPSPTEQATVPAITPPLPAATPPPATHRPNRDKTPVPTEQPTVTAVAVATVGVAPVLAAEARALPAPTSAPAGATSVAALALQPSQLPNTGGQATPTWLALGIAGILLSVGWLVRRRSR